MVDRLMEPVEANFEFTDIFDIESLYQARIDGLLQFWSLSLWYIELFIILPWLALKYLVFND